MQEMRVWREGEEACRTERFSQGSAQVLMAQCRSWVLNHMRSLRPLGTSKDDHHAHCGRGKGG
jgi:hypothetical protein